MGEQIADRYNPTQQMSVNPDGSINTGAASFNRVQVSDGGYLYVAEAEPGTNYGSTGWRIRRQETITGGLKITWAEGNAFFDKVASSCAGYSYS